MLAPLDNEIIFKKVFTDKEVFEHFVNDLFDIDIKVAEIETEKRFSPPVADIDFKLDIYAETQDHRFIIEIQKINYDYNFKRFLNYFVSVLIEQQKKGSKYHIPQTVLGVVVITTPYKISQLTYEPIKANVMTIDFNPRDLDDKIVKLWNHKLIFFNPHKDYHREDTPIKYLDWLNLFRLSIENSINITLNLNNRGIEKAAELAQMDNLNPRQRYETMIAESKKVMTAINEKIGFEKGEQIGLEKGEQIGLEKGEQKKALETAKKLLTLGIEINIIAQATGLSVKQIEEL